MKYLNRFLITLLILLIASLGYCTDYTQDANCMGAWLMTSNGTDELDVSGENATMSQTSGTIPTSATVPSGYSGTSRDIELNDYEWFEQADGLSTDISGADQSISIVLWVHREGDTQYSEKWFSKYASSNYQYALDSPAWSTDYLRFGLSDDGTTISMAKGATNLPNDNSTWVHLAGVYNDTDIRVYVDGSLDSNGSDNPKTYNNGIYNGTGKASIGYGQTTGDNSGYMDGLITEVAIFNRELTSIEVSDIYTNFLEGSAAPSTTLYGGTFYGGILN